MIEADFHNHTLFSACGLHTHLEMINRAEQVGLSVFGITDHGRAIGGRTPSTFIDRFQYSSDNFRLLKGVEANVLNEKGEIDLPPRANFLDIVLLGYHANTEKNRGIKYYTDTLIKAMERNSSIDILTHINNATYQVDFKSIAEAAKELGVLIEFNNSKVRYQRIPNERTIKLIEACQENGNFVAVNSDSHTVTEVGDVSAVWSLIEEVGFNQNFIVNRYAKDAIKFVESRRKNKLILS